jgi:hypothetical protein
MGPTPQESFESTRLLESARCGDGAAWEKLIGRYRPYLLAVAIGTIRDSRSRRSARMRVETRRGESSHGN